LPIVPVWSAQRRATGLTPETASELLACLGWQRLDNTQEATMPSGAAPPWALILAGGDGVRLRGLTRRISGDTRPKQYCAIDAAETLLERTRRRATLVAGRHRQVVVVNGWHEPYYRYLFEDMPAEHVVVQPENRGTAAGILYPLLRIARLAGTPPVVVLPSDHHVSDDVALADHLSAATAAAVRHPDVVILIGVHAGSPETDYGWIEPAATPVADPTAVLVPIRRFWEKPSAALAQQLMNRGCLWNSFMMVGMLSAFHALARDTVPDLVADVQRLRVARTAEEEAALAVQLYAGVSHVNFSDAVLARGTHRLVTLAVKDLEWCDWGHPARVIASLCRSGARPAWLTDVALDPAV
jgi:mannose-1-phosphate guanylyltransferase